MSRQGAEENRERSFHWDLLDCCWSELFKGKRILLSTDLLEVSFAFETAAEMKELKQH